MKNKISSLFFIALPIICLSQKIDSLLIIKLNAIYLEDSKYRIELEELEKKYGKNATEIKNHWKIISEKDSVNQVQVRQILDQYGWLGSDVIGEQGNAALFFVIQHSNLATQEKYLPMMKEASKSGKVSKSRLALFEDRIAVRQGKKQIYGTQIGTDKETGLDYILPLEDPDNVDKRRAEVGLPPMIDYANAFQIKWDVEQYKKDLPKIQAKQKK